VPLAPVEPLVICGVATALAPGVSNRNVRPEQNKELYKKGTDVYLSLLQLFKTFEHKNLRLIF
jgi:hypothetical protein